MDLIDTSELDAIFGEGSSGSTPEARARSSSRVFVRSQDHLSVAKPTLGGHKISAWEALQAFGLGTLREVFEYSSAILPITAEEPAATLSARRESLEFSLEDVANLAKLSVETIMDAENPRTRTPISEIEKIAQALALDELVISFVAHANGDRNLAFRLKELGRGTSISSSLRSRLCEAAWVILKQRQLDRWLDPGRRYPIDTIQPSPEYGDAVYPAWQRGYWRAHDTRDCLGIPPDSPIPSLHGLIEKQLGIPVVQQRLVSAVAGATVVNGSARGITVNTTGYNENVWVRRVTLAHELGHLLWDPDKKLKNLQVDEYRDLDQDPHVQGDRVEARANAFAVEFLAPKDAARNIFENSANPCMGLRNVMEEFGLSFTSARFHIWNALDRSFPLESLIHVSPEPTDEWKGRESFGLDFFRPESVPDSRRGLFAYLVVKAADAKLLTEESAATYLACTPEEYSADAGVIRQMFD